VAIERNERQRAARSGRSEYTTDRLA